MEEVNYTNLTSCIVAISRKISKYELAVILSNITFSFLKRQVHIFRMPATFVTSFKSVAQKLRRFDYTIFQVLWIVAKISKFEKAVILSKMIFFSFQKGRDTCTVCLYYLRQDQKLWKS